MRLWHQNLIHYLDSKRLLSQHRECCALRGKGWGKKHSVVDYVFTYSPAHLFAYHRLVMVEMHKRGFKVDANWYGRMYRGKNIQRYATLDEAGTYVYSFEKRNGTIYAEHNDAYLKECLLNLKSKGAELVNGKTIDEMLIGLDLKSV